VNMNKNMNNIENIMLKKNKAMKDAPQVVGSDLYDAPPKVGAKKSGSGGSGSSSGQSPKKKQKKNGSSGGSSSSSSSGSKTSSK